MASFETITFTASVVIALLGVAALVCVAFVWHGIARFYRETAAKLVVAGFRFLAAAAALASRSEFVPGVPLLAQPWVPTCLVAIGGYLVWEAAGILGDAKWKAAKERTAADYADEIELLGQDRDDAVRQFKKMARAASRAGKLSAHKFQRIRRALEKSGEARPSLPATRNALAPDSQIMSILEALTALLSDDVVEAGGPLGQNFRVGLYVELDGYLVPKAAFDMTTRRHDPFGSYSAHKERFRIGEADAPAHVVRSLTTGTIIVGDCLSEPHFEFFTENQRSYLRSMVAHPLPTFCFDGLNPSRAVIAVDTNVSGYFRTEDREPIVLRLELFAALMELEYAVLKLTSS